MRAAVIKNFGGPEQLKIADIPTPAPLANEVQIEVAYAAINPVDWKIREGHLKSRMPFEFPITLGWDVSGVISKIGKDVKNLKVGDEVFAYAKRQSIHNGTFAEYICLEAQHVVPKPKKLTLREASTIPLAGLTAWQSIVEAINLQPNEVLFIQGGAGCVGSLGIQIAKNIGAKIITTASVQNHSQVKKLGADIAIDYHSENYVDKIEQLYPNGIDVTFDCVGGKTVEGSLQVLRRGGRFVSLLEKIDPLTESKYGIHAYYVFVRADGGHLKILAELVDAGKIVPPTIQEFPFEKASEALEMVKQGHIKGKAVLKVR